MRAYVLADPTRYPHMTTAELRETFLMDSLNEPGAVHLVYVISTGPSWVSRRRSGSQLLWRQMRIFRQGISLNSGK